MAKPKTVIVWGREDLLARAVEVFLAGRQDWEVVRFSEERGIDSLIQEVETRNADVVIIHQGDCSGESRLPMRLLKARPGLKVITFSLENNSIEIYNKRKIWVKGVADLLSVVDG